MPVEPIFSIDPETINYHDPNEVKKVIQPLFNIVESLYKENQALRKENQALKDEVNRLKGEQGNPKIKPKTNNDISAPKQKKTGKKKREKRNTLKRTIFQ